MANASEGLSRLNPKPWERLYYPLTRLREAIASALGEDLALAPGQRVVDVGCGNCPYRPLFAETGCEYVGCDIDGDVDVRFTPGERIDLPDGYADGVVSFQVLEHVWDLDWYLGECQRLLKPGGWLLLSTHGCWPYHPHPTDFRRWTQDGLAQELLIRGLPVATARGIVGPLAWSTYLRLYSAEYLFSRLPLAGAPLFAMLGLVMNVRMRLEDAITPAPSRLRNACTYIMVCRKPAAG